MTTRTLTVLICTHDRRRLLMRTLEHLHRARRPEGWTVEVLVMLNACSDDSEIHLAHFAQAHPDLPLRWASEPVPGKSNALNSAMALIESELTAFVDDDHRVATDYLVEVCRAAERHPEADLFCGRILPDWDGSEPPWVHDEGPFRIYPLPVPRFDQGDAPHRLTPDQAIPGGGNLFLRTPWLQRTGPFSTDLGPVGHDLGGSEDLEWVLRAQKLGARLWYIPTVIQYHYVDGSRLTLPYVVRKAYRRSASVIGVSTAKTTPGVPRYLYRKLGGYLLRALTAWRADRRRFYLVRSAATLGEIQGHRRWQPPPASNLD